MSDKYAKFKCRECGRWLVPINPESERDTTCCLCIDGHGRTVHGITPKDLKAAMKAEADELHQEKVREWMATLGRAKKVSTGWEIEGLTGTFAMVRKIADPLVGVAVADGNRLGVIEDEVWEFRASKRQPKVRA